MRKFTLLLPVSLLALHLSGLAAPPARQPRTLLIAVDGVGYDVAQEMYRNGELPHFLAPAPLINAFPSTTNPGLVEILQPEGAPPARGYEDVFYDPCSNRMRGSVFHRFSRRYFIESTFRRVFDYHPDNIRMTLEYAVPLLGPWFNARLTMARIKRAFQQSDDSVYLAYIASSDLAIHLNGKWLLKDLLRRLDRMVGDLRADLDKPVEVIVFSDHGNQLAKWRRARLHKALHDAGFQAQGTLQDDSSVVLPQYGLIGSASLHTRPGQEPAVAEVLAQAEGVDVAVYRRKESLVVVRRRGMATIQRRSAVGGNSYRYLPLTGDPLELGPIVQHLRENAVLDPVGFAPESDWLRATSDHTYPDPLRRLWQGFEWVDHPASVLVSLEDGYYTGSWLLDIFAPLQATHGNLRQAQSRGVVLSTNPAVIEADGDPLTGSTLLNHIHRVTAAVSGETGYAVSSMSPAPEDNQ